MCLTCGCNEPNSPHGSAANITLKDMQAAADEQDISLTKATKNLLDTLRYAGKVKMASNNNNSLRANGGGSGSNGGNGSSDRGNRFVSQGDDEFLSDFEIIDAEEADDNATMQAEERAEEAVSGKPPSRSAALNALRDVLSKRKPSGS